MWSSSRQSSAENIMSGRTKSNPACAIVETQLGPLFSHTPSAILPDASFSKSLLISVSSFDLYLERRSHLRPLANLVAELVRERLRRAARDLGALRRGFLANVG